jgi:inhibitor of cysteine peptidase
MSGERAQGLGGRALAGEPPGRPLVRLTRADADTDHPIGVRKGDTVELRLPRVPAGGYLWRWRLPEGLRMMDDEHEPDGQLRLTFDVHSTGRHEFRVELARPWESESRQALTFTVEAQ